MRVMLRMKNTEKSLWKMLDQVRDVIRKKWYSIRTEQSW